MLYFNKNRFKKANCDAIELHVLCHLTLTMIFKITIVLMFMDEDIDSGHS